MAKVAAVTAKAGGRADLAAVKVEVRAAVADVSNKIVSLQKQFCSTS